MPAAASRGLEGRDATPFCPGAGFHPRAMRMASVRFADRTRSGHDSFALIMLTDSIVPSCAEVNMNCWMPCSRMPASTKSTKRPLSP